MIKSTTPAARALTAGVLGLLLVACDRQETPTSERGPAERAGEQLDQALTRAGEELNKVAEKTGKNLQDMGRRLQHEANEAQQARERQEEQAARSEQRAQGPDETQVPIEERSSGQ